MYGGKLQQLQAESMQIDGSVLAFPNKLSALSVASWPPRDDRYKPPPRKSCWPPTPSAPLSWQPSDGVGAVTGQVLPTNRFASTSLEGARSRRIT
jgi:hypothetical protein